MFSWRYRGKSRLGNRIDSSRELFEYNPEVLPDYIVYFQVEVCSENEILSGLGPSRIE